MAFLVPASPYTPTRRLSLSTRILDMLLREAVTRRQLASCFLVQLHAKRKWETMQERYQNPNDSGALELCHEHGNISLHENPTTSGVWEPCLEHKNLSPVPESQ